MMRLSNFTFTTAWYPLSQNLQSTPAQISLRVRSNQGQAWDEPIVLPLEQLHAARLKKICPFLQIPGSRKAVQQFDDELMAKLERELAAGIIERGYYLEHSGAIHFPDGMLQFLAGSELIPNHCNRRYLPAPHLGNIRLVGEGNTSLQEMEWALVEAPAQALLTLAYVLLTSVRSMVIDQGIDFQAVLYILGGQGLGKTTLAKRTAGLYQTEEGYVSGLVQAGSTMAGIRDMLVRIRDRPVIVDDLCLSAGKDTERRRREVGATLVREGSGNTPIIKKFGSGVAESHCHAGVILTAEFPLSNMSDLTRCILVPVHEKLELAPSWTPTVVGDVLRRFFTWFSDHHIDALNTLTASLNKGWKPKLEKRVRTNYICLRWAFRTLLECLTDSGMAPQYRANLEKKMRFAVKQGLNEYELLRKEQLDLVPKGNLSFCILRGYKDKAFYLANNLERLKKRDGVIWKDDLCIRPQQLLSFVRQQPGYHQYTRNQLTLELMDLGVLVIQEDSGYTVHLAKSKDGASIPRVYRLRLDVLKETAKKY